MYTTSTMSKLSADSHRSQIVLNVAKHLDNIYPHKPRTLTQFSCPVMANQVPTAITTDQPHVWKQLLLIDIHVATL